MKKSTKISLLVSLILVIAGAVTVFVSLLCVGFDTKKFSNMTFEKKVFEITENFEQISIDDVDDNINLHLATDGKCKVICHESEKMYHKCLVDNNVLRVNCTDKRAWYEKIGISFKEDTAIDVYLPDDEYYGVVIETINGDITLTENLTERFKVRVLYLSTVNGNIKSSADVTGGAVQVNAKNGDIDLSGNLKAQRMIVFTTNGKITANHMVDVEWAGISTTNGNIDINGDNIKSIDIYSKNGSIGFNIKNPDKINAQTVNGNIMGTMPANKKCVAQSTNGSVNVPNRVENYGDFYFQTVNGNIDVKEK